MQLENRLSAFNKLRNKISSLSENEITELAQRAKAQNGWFSEESVRNALAGIAFMLEEDKLKEWTSRYDLKNELPKIVGIVMAGNIPLVGFHDLLSVLISGNFAAVKASSDDEFLTQTIIDWITEIEPRFKKNLELREKLTQIDTVIATGSDNTARYFEYYFRNIPKIIRKNRTSVAVLNGEEKPEELMKLGEDIFSYYGLGCRNISKVFTPTGYDIREAFPPFEAFKDIIHHNKYCNNYEYHKSIYLVNKTPHLDTGFLLITTTDDLVSPISVLYHQEYDTISTLNTVLKQHKEKIQCIVGKDHIPFGKVQRPELWDYADDVDTLDFLTKSKVN